MLAKGDFSQLGTIVVADQEEDAQNFVDGVEPMIAASARLRSLLSEVFPEVDVLMFFPPGDQFGGWVGDWQLDTVDDNTEEEATAVLVSPEQDELGLRLLLVDGVWRIEHPNIPDADSLDEAAESIDRLVTAYEDLANGIEDEEFTEAEDLESEFQRIMDGGELGEDQEQTVP